MTHPSDEGSGPQARERSDNPAPVGARGRTIRVRDRMDLCLTARHPRSGRGSSPPEKGTVSTSHVPSLSSGELLAVVPGGVFVVDGVVSETAVEDADEPVG
jgi:hypothetical protein